MTVVTTARKYYFVEVNYHDLTTKREDEQRMSEYGEVGHDKRGAFWKVKRSRREVSNALCRLGYALVRTEAKNVSK